jgi:hypothetical protein
MVDGHVAVQRAVSLVAFASLLRALLMAVQLK